MLFCNCPKNLNSRRKIDIHKCLMKRLKRFMFVLNHRCLHACKRTNPIDLDRNGVIKYRLEDYTCPVNVVIRSNDMKFTDFACVKEI